MISLIARTFRGPVRAGSVPLAAIALTTACLACYLIVVRKAQPIWQRLPRVVVRRVSFDACQTANGVAQSSEQTVVKCRLENLQTRSKGVWYFSGGASTILEIIPDGTTVKKGDVLCILDASNYEDRVDLQTINVESHRAEMVQTDLALLSAELALREYTEGLFHQDMKGFQGSVALAESEMKRAADRLAWSEQMVVKGYASTMQLATDRQTLLRSTVQLRQAQLELDTYRRFRAPKTIFALKADFEKARAMSIHETGDYHKSQAQLAHYRDLVERCTIRAPHDGFVIYANGPFREEDERSRIELGASVRQNQELFYFPNLSKMEIVAMMHETVVDRVRRGMPARLRLESLRDVAVQGLVESVASLPRRSFNDVPYYDCRITLEAAPPGLMPGMSAEVEVQLGRCCDVLAVPSEAVSVDNYRKLCYVIGPSGLERREIKIGGSSPNLIEVTDGLKEGETVVLNLPRDFDRSELRPDPSGSDQLETAAFAALR